MTIYSNVFKEMKNSGTCILSLPPRYGKILMAIKMSIESLEKTLVVINHKVIDEIMKISDGSTRIGKTT